MPLYDPSKSFFPLAIDAFAQAANGNTPDNLITAASFNKISNAVMAVEGHAQYTLQSPSATGSAVIFLYQKYDLTTSLPLPGLDLSLKMAVPDALRSVFAFDGQSPFNRQYAIFAYASGYRTNHAFRFSYPVRSAVNVRQENNSSVLVLNCVKATPWTIGDSLEACVMLARV